MMRLLFPALLTATGVLALLPQDPRKDPNKPQQPTAATPSTTTPRETTLQDANSKMTDEFLAGWALMGSENEITLSELAVQRASNPEVKQFAQKMIDEHRQMVEKLQPFTSGTDLGMGGAPSSDRPATAPAHEPGRAQEASAAHMTGSFDHNGLIRELSEQCLQSSRKELEQKQGADFDRCYMGMAIGQHIGANDALTVFQRHASSALKAVFADSQKVVASHLQAAKDIAKKLESGTTTAARDTSGK